MNRRKFLQRSSLVSAGVILGSKPGFTNSEVEDKIIQASPLVVSTWDFGAAANREAWNVIASGGRALDAIESGIKLVEADPTNHSVGIGGFPDREGMVTLDASIMDEHGNAGSVTFLREIMHPISVARLVMEKTPHVMLSGEGALQFALENGFKRQNLLTDEAKDDWKKWQIQSNYKPVINIENHDTIGMLALDYAGNLSGGCSTSGVAFKMHGRVGDSPIIGAGLFVDNDIGAAVATGLGELMMRTLSSFLVVELMRSGYSPQEACEKAILRIVKHNPDYKDLQAAIIALNKKGETGSYAIQEGFTYALSLNNHHALKNSDFYNK